MREWRTHNFLPKKETRLENARERQDWCWQSSFEHLLRVAIWLYEVRETDEWNESQEPHDEEFHWNRRIHERGIRGENQATRIYRNVVSANNPQEWSGANNMGILCFARVCNHHMRPIQFICICICICICVTVYVYVHIYIYLCVQRKQRKQRSLIRFVILYCFPRGRGRGRGRGSRKLKQTHLLVRARVCRIRDSERKRRGRGSRDCVYVQTNKR